MKTMIKNVKKVALLLTLVFGLSAMVNAQTKTAIKIADLQKGITDNITQNYPGYKIKDAYKIEKNKIITYDVYVEKGMKNVCLSYDNAGKFITVVEPKSKSLTGNKMKTNSKTNNKSNTKINEKSTSSNGLKLKPLGKKSIIG